jgi:hypothetical protein
MFSYIFTAIKHNVKVKTAKHAFCSEKTIIERYFVINRVSLGFLSTLDEAAPGNYGLYDVLKVLEWIQKHISQFGGNPNQVTLVGSDSGSALISLLLVSPKRSVNGGCTTSNLDYCFLCDKLPSVGL